MDRADQAEVVPRRHQVGRDRPGQRHRVLDRLVAIAVAERDLVARHARHQDHPVRGRRAVGDEIGAIGTEHAGGVALGFADRTRVVEQRTQLADRDRQIGPEQLLAEELEEGTAGRVLQERRAAGVPRRVPRVLVGPGECGQGLEHRRQQRRPIAIDRGGDPAADEVGGILEQPDVVVDLLEDLGGHLGERAARGEQEHRQLRGARAHGGDDLARALVIRRPGQFPVDQSPPAAAHGWRSAPRLRRATRRRPHRCRGRAGPGPRPRSRGPRRSPRPCRCGPPARGGRTGSPERQA